MIIGAIGNAATIHDAVKSDFRFVISNAVAITLWNPVTHVSDYM